MVGELGLKVRLKERAQHFLQQLIRPCWQSQGSQLAVLLGNMHAANRRPSIAFMAKVANDAVNLLSVHAVHGFRCCAWGHCPVIAVEACVGTQVQLRVVEQGVNPSERLSFLAAFSDDVQKRFSSLHVAYLPLHVHPNHLPPFALCRAFPRPMTGRNSGDYYGGSVAMALAGCRRSRGTSSSYVRGRCRRPTHPLA